MLDPQATPPPDAHPAFVKKLLLWLTAGAAVLGGLALALDGGQRVADAGMKLYRTFAGTPAEKTPPVAEVQPTTPPATTTSESLIRGKKSGSSFNDSPMNAPANATINAPRMNTPNQIAPNKRSEQ